MYYKRVVHRALVRLWNILRDLCVSSMTVTAVKFTAGRISSLDGCWCWGYSTMLIHVHKCRVVGWFWTTYHDVEKIWWGNFSNFSQNRWSVGRNSKCRSTKHRTATKNFGCRMEGTYACSTSVVKWPRGTPKRVGDGDFRIDLGKTFWKWQIR